MTCRPPLPDVEIVVVARDQAPTLDAAVRQLHQHLREHLAVPWRLTIADHASADGTGEVADRLVAELDGVEAVHLPGGLDRRELRARWRSSPARVAAFLTVGPETDPARALAPLLAHTASPSARRGARRPAGARGRAPLATRVLSRRTALAALGGAGLTALVAACGSGSSSADTTSPSATTPATVPATTSGGAGDTSATTAATTAAPATTATTATTTVDTSAVVLAPEMTEGPYYLDLDLVRSDVVEDRQGAPLSLRLVVVDVGAGAPIEGAAVDIWHCDAEGLYSGFVAASAGANSASSTDDDGTFLRGTQLSDVDGAVTFGTIYPGWYQGRTVHIHLKVHVEGTTVHTGQLFFDDGFTDEVYAARAPYASRAERDVRNDDDNIYAGGGAQSTVVVQAAGDGYASTLVMGVAAS